MPDQPEIIPQFFPENREAFEVLIRTCQFSIRLLPPVFVEEIFAWCLLSSPVLAGPSSGSAAGASEGRR
jgi:hypothetical protein